MIPLIKPYLAPREEMMPALEEILYSGYIAEGEAVRQFEREFSGYIQNQNTLALNSCTAALHLALLVLNIGPGDEVISTALTAEPTNTTIALTGAKVVWADIDETTGLLSPQSIREKITAHTKAIMLVHYAGMVCDLDAVNEISREFNIPVIEDAAHALGSRYRNKPVGSNSDYTCFSFQAIKHMTTVDGGMITFAGAGASNLEEARKLKWFGLRKDVSRMENDISRAGYKYNMNNVTATIGLTQMRHLREIIDRHVANGQYYDQALAKIPGITLLRYCDNTRPSYWLYTLKAERRDDLARRLETEGIAASPLHHRSDTHSVFAASRCPLPALDRFYEEFLHIPCGWWVTDEDRERIVDCISKGW